MVKISATPKSFEGLVAKQIADTTNQLLDSVKPDTGRGANSSRVLAELFMWNWIRKYADNQYDKLLQNAKDDKVLGAVEELKPGNHVLAESRHFVVTASVSEPVRRFAPELLCSWAWAKFKIPVIVMKEQLEKAKTPGKSAVRLTITERE